VRTAGAWTAGLAGGRLAPQAIRASVDDSREKQLSHWRILGVLWLLVSEALILGSLVPHERWKQWGEAWSNQAVGFATLGGLGCAGSLLAVTGLWGERLVGLLNQPSERSRPTPRRWFAMHLLLFGLLLVTTLAVVQGRHGGAALAAWMACAWGMTACLALVLLPGSFWWQFARFATVPALLGILVGGAVQYAGGWTLQPWEPLTRSTAFFVRGTMFLVRGLLQLFTSDVHFDAERVMIGTTTFSVEILAPCSGYEGIALIWAFLATYLWLRRNRLRFPHALLLVPAGTALIWLTNGIRLALLIAIGTLWSPGIALGGFHSTMGSVMFMCVGLALVVVSDRLAFFRKDAVPQLAGSGRVTPYLLPFMVLIGLRMICGALSANFDYLYPLCVVGVAAALAWRSADYAGWDRSWSWTPVAIGLLAYGIWIALESTHSNVWATEHRMPLALQTLPAHWALAWIAVRVIGSTTTVPLAEELAFRGFLMRRMQAADFESVPLGQFSWLSFFGSSLLFGLLHGRWLAGTLAGMLFALALYQRRRLSDAVIAHATTNALLAAHVLAGESWQLWS